MSSVAQVQQAEAQLRQTNAEYQKAYESYMSYKKVNKNALDLYHEQMEILCIIEKFFFFKLFFSVALFIFLSLHFKNLLLKHFTNVKPVS